MAHSPTLKRWRHVVSLPEMIQGLRAGEGLKKRAATTFDDGHLNNFLKAAHALADFYGSAAFFIATGLLATDLGIYFQWMLLRGR